MAEHGRTHWCFFTMSEYTIFECQGLCGPSVPPQISAVLVTPSFLIATAIKQNP